MRARFERRGDFGRLGGVNREALEPPVTLSRPRTDVEASIVGRTGTCCCVEPESDLRQIVAKGGADGYIEKNVPRHLVPCAIQEQPATHIS
jgi:hypothetical protein